MKRLICILFLFCTVIMHAEMRLNKSTGKYYSVPVMSEVDQDEYDRLYKKYWQKTRKILKLRSSKCTKLFNELEMLVEEGIKTNKQQEKYNELQKRCFHMAEDGLKSGDPFWVGMANREVDIERVGSTASKRLLEDIHKIELKDVPNLTMGKHETRDKRIRWFISCFMLVLALRFVGWLRRGAKLLWGKLFKKES